MPNNRTAEVYVKSDVMLRTSRKSEGVRRSDLSVYRRANPPSQAAAAALHNHSQLAAGTRLQSLSHGSLPRDNDVLQGVRGGERHIRR